MPISHVQPAFGGQNDNLTPDFYGFARTDIASAVNLASPGDAPVLRGFPVASAARHEYAGQLLGAYVDDYYYRVHVLPADIDVGNLAVEQRIDLWVWNAWLTSQTLTHITGLEEGTEIELPHTLPHTYAPLEETLYALAISPIGPSAISLTLTFGFSGIADPRVHVTGNRVVAFPWPVDWSEPVHERISWLTDVLTSENGTEQRRAMRHAPRVQLSARLIVANADRAFLDLALNKWAARAWCVPLWQDAQRLTGALAKGATFIPCRTQGFDFAVGLLALLVDDASALTHEAEEVLEVRADGLLLRRELQNDWPVSSRLYPCRMGRLVSPPQAERHTDALDTLDVDFQLLEPRSRAGTLPIDTWRGLPLFLERPNEDRTLTRSQERITFTLDNETGVITVTDAADRAFQTLDHRFLTGNRAATLALLDLLYALNGRQKAVWVPTHAADLTPVAPAWGTTLPVARVGYARFGVGTPGRQDILIVLKDGTWLTRRITAAEDTGAREELALDATLPQVLLPEDIARISYLICARLASDDIDIEHLTDNDGIARTAIRWRAVR